MRLFEFAQDGDNYYLITEFCEGGELVKQILKLKSFSESTAAGLIKQLLSALVYCHSKHIVHRDIKAENLMLEGASIKSNLKVIDFGTSRMFKPKEKLKDLQGTVSFFI